MTVCGGAGAEGQDQPPRQPSKEMPARPPPLDHAWDELGKKAGPLPNQRMLDEGKPDLVVAFPGAGGTKDMVRRAVKAGVPVHEVNRADDW
jgi:hypothetical protein